MGLVDALTNHRRDKHTRRSPATSTGWRVAYGSTSKVSEESSWQDESFAVIDGQWEACPAERFIAVGDI
jgi:hypothetical protein